MSTRLDPHRSDSALEVLCAADYPAEEVSWLWPGRLPIGKVTLLVGDPGTGKSLVALDIAARVSSGAAWPDEPETDEWPGLDKPYMWSSVLILSAEDGLRDTIRPRLDAAGANPDNVYLLPSVTDLRNDLDKIRAAVDKVSNCSLVIIDPINAFMGPGDSHFHTVVRKVIQPLADLAAEKGFAVLAVSHLRKHDGAAIQRAAGSMGFVSAARSVWTVCRDSVQTDRHLFLPLKNNFSANTDGLAYSITSAKSSSPGNTAPTIHWQTDPVMASAVEAMQPEKNSRGPEPAELTLAMDYVQRELLTGPKSAEYMHAGAAGGGFSDRTVRRALVAIGGKTRKERPYGFGSWLWYLPDHDFQGIETATSENGESASEASPLQRAVAEVAAAPDKPVPDPSKNLSPSRKNGGAPAETCPLREKTIEPAFVFEQTLPADELATVPPKDSLLPLRKLTPDQTWELMFKKSSEDPDISYDYDMAQCKVRRLIIVRSRRPKVLFKRTEINLVKSQIFKPRCRAP